MAVLSLLWVGLILWMYHVARADPVVRSTTLTVAGLKSPRRLLLVSDVHVAGPDMPPERLRRIVHKLNALKPDLVLLAGDFVSDKSVATRRYPLTQAIAPLGKLRARFGAIAVLGNHDHWRDAQAARRALAKTGIMVLNNDAVNRGGLSIGGVDDAFTGNDNLPVTLERMRASGAPQILVSHSPDVFPKLPDDVRLTVAGHTHCGQIRLPFVGPPATASAYGNRYACGRVDENGRTLVVSAGLGTSLLPLRLGAVPDVWLVELRPAA